MAGIAGVLVGGDLNSAYIVAAGGKVLKEPGSGFKSEAQQG